MKDEETTVTDPENDAGQQRDERADDEDVQEAIDRMHVTSWLTNLKKLFDDHETHSVDEMAATLEARNRSRSSFDSLQNLSLQVLQRAADNADLIAKQAIESANLIGKQAINNADLIAKQAIESANTRGKQETAHRDLATDRQWNVDEVASLLERMGVPRDVAAAAAAAIAAQIAAANK